MQVTLLNSKDFHWPFYLLLNIINTQLKKIEVKMKTLLLIVLFISSTAFAGINQTFLSCDFPENTWNINSMEMSHNAIEENSTSDNLVVSINYINGDYENFSVLMNKLDIADNILNQDIILAAGNLTGEQNTDNHPQTHSIITTVKGNAAGFIGFKVNGLNPIILTSNINCIWE